MKRLGLCLLVSFTLTGCFFGEVGSGYITKTCTKETSYFDVNVIEDKIIKYKDNKVVSIIFNNTVKVDRTNDTFKSIKNSYMSEKNSLSSLGIKTTEIMNSETEYNESYEFVFSSLNDELKSKYNFDDVSYNQIKKYEEEGYNCK